LNQQKLKQLLHIVFFPLTNRLHLCFQKKNELNHQLELKQC